MTDLAPAHRPTHAPALDGVRGLAIAAVLAIHLTRPFGTHLPPSLGALRVVGSVGWMGVDLFFVLSGFLITGILWDTRHDDHRFRNFYARRTLRILPIYLLTVIAVAVWTAVQHHRGVDLGGGVRTLLMLATYTLNLGLALQGWPAAEFAGLNVIHFWSLAIEEQFYLLWPAVVFAVRFRTLVRLCMTIVVAAPLLRATLHVAGASSDALFYATPCRLDGLALGALLALHVRNSPQLSRWSAFESAGLAGLAGIAILALCQGKLTETLPGSAIVGLTCVACCSAALVRQCLVSSRVARLLASRPLTWLGRYSYGLYVYHFFIVQSVRAQFDLDRLTAGRYALLVLIVLGSSAAVSLISFHLIESPLLRLKRFFPRSPTKIS